MAESALRNLQRERMNARRERAGMEPFVPQAPTKTAGQAMADFLGGISVPLSFVPLAGDVAGLGADAAMYAAYPEERTLGNAAMTLAGIVPGIPGAAAMRAGEKATDAIQQAPAEARQMLDRSNIRSLADNLANQLNEVGFKTTVTHSGSAAGPSSYVEILDPQTGRYFANPVRFSSHGKGPREAAGVIDILDVEKDTQDIIKMAIDMRGRGKSPRALYDEKVAELQSQGMTPRQARSEAFRLFKQ